MSEEAKTDFQDSLKAEMEAQLADSNLFEGGTVEITITFVSVTNDRRKRRSVEYVLRQ